MSNIKLSERERRIAAHLGTQAEVTVQQAARALRIRPHQIKYTLDRMLERGVLRKAWIFDIYRLGLNCYSIFFCLNAESTSSREKLIEAFRSAPQCVYLTELGGDFDFQLDVVEQGVEQLLGFFDSLSRSYGEPFLNKAVSIRHRVTRFSRKYLAPRYAAKCTVATGGHIAKQVEIDDLDRDILTYLTHHPHASRPEIGRALGRSSSTIELRYRRLRETGVIAGAVYSTRPEQYGAQAHVLLLFARGLTGALSKQLLGFAEQHQHVTYLVEGVGAWDFEMGVEVESYHQLVEIKEQLSQKFARDIIQTKVLTRFSVHKYGTFPVERA